jgi:hypothetical protein
MCDKCKGQISDTFVRSMASTLWAMGWANHAEEHDCYNLSGCEITSVMPEVPEIAYRMAERIAGAIEATNGASLACLFAAAMKADGSPELEHEDYHGEDAEDFGHCLAHMAEGSGISWYDNHKRFELGKYFKNQGAMIVPRSEAVFELQMYADETCKEPSEPDTLCHVCQLPYHDTCANNPNCPCCCDTMARANES